MSVSLVAPVAKPFVARTHIRKEMLALLDERRAAGSRCLICLHGLEGLGVSSLATQFHLDNQQLVGGPLIWLAGRTVHGDPVPFDELAGQVLRALGVREADQDSTASGRAAACRQLLSQSACMVVVDDLVALEQIEPWLPPEAPRLVVVVTTPVDRPDLVVAGFRPYTPEFLTVAEARELFLLHLGRSAAAVPDAVVDGLVALCGGIPLLVKVLAAHIADRPHVAEALLTELRETRLELLALDAQERMGRFFDFAYGALSEDLRRMYRLLPLLPGPDVSPSLVAAALDLRPTTALLRLEDLVRHNLLVRIDTDRYALHPVVRDDARSRLHAEDDEETRRDAQVRAATWLLREALPRGLAISGRWWVEPVLRQLRDFYDDDIPAFTRDEARTWFDNEMDRLIAIATLTGSYVPELLPSLAIATWKYLHLHLRLDDLISMHEQAVEVASEAADEALLMQLLSQKGAVHLDLKDFAAARACFEESLDHARSIKHALGQQSAIEWLGKVDAAEGAHEQARERFHASWEFAQAHAEHIGPIQLQRLLALLGLQLARSAVALGDWSAALAELADPIRYFDSRDDETDNRAKCRLTKAQALIGLGDLDSGMTTFHDAIRLFDEEGARKPAAQARELLAPALATAGLRDAAAAEYEVALGYYEQVGSPRAAVVRAALATLDVSD